MKLEFKRLPEIDRSEIIELMTHPRLRAHMPLSGDDFDERRCKAFVAAKERMWADHGYGPWAFVVDGRFAGWGGLQPENGEADLGLVLHPRFWGIGKVLAERILARAFGEMGFESVTVLLPPTRRRIGGLIRMGFAPDGELEVDGERFKRYRISSTDFG